MSGILYLCATPIGNLRDMSERVLQTLQEVDLIAAEDTRNSLKLLNHFEIHTPMTSYHEFNKVEKADELVEKLRQGMNIALITDAGTPAISDPGEVLVQKCAEAGITVTSLPGACALITALTVSGLPTRRFAFEAFLPSEKDDKKELNRILDDLKKESRTIILYEAPHRLQKTLKLLYETLGNRRIALCRELTKKFEDINRTDLEGAIAFYEQNEPRGEYVLVIDGFSHEEQQNRSIEDWNKLTIEEHMAYYEATIPDKKEAMKQVAKDRGISKREVYQYLLKMIDK